MSKTISLELAKFIKEKGWDLESELLWDIKRNQLIRRRDCSGDFLNYCFLEIFPAYTWQEILIDYAFQFFGEDIKPTDPDYIPRWSIISHGILDRLQNNKIQETEDYIKQHLLTNK